MEGYHELERTLVEHHLEDIQKTATQPGWATGRSMIRSPRRP
jgi:hypothetical protein